MDPSVLGSGAPRSGLSDADIYLTTWIGTKAVIRPEVQTVGILDADTWIRRPDFRAAENAFQAISEMSAWAGPASKGGRLVIQTAEPGHHAIQAVARGNPGYFAARELEYRRELGYPPVTELIKVRFQGAAAEELSALVRRLAEEEGARVLGPVPVRSKRTGEKLAEVLLKCPNGDSVARRLRVILPDVPRGSSVFVDVDPR
jgi:primosomal protein N' (replication factor Y)